MAPRTAPPDSRRRPAPLPPGAADRGWAGGARCALGCAAAFWALATGLDLGAGTLDPARAALWAGLAAALFAVLLPPRVSAGRGWLAVRGLLRVRRVRTDALVSVRHYAGASGDLVLHDSGGRRLHLDPRVLAANPLLWHELDAGARASSAAGTLRCGGAEVQALSGRLDAEVAHAVFRASGLR